jgi:hypothetical protein
MAMDKISEKDQFRYSVYLVLVVIATVAFILLQDAFFKLSSEHMNCEEIGCDTPKEEKVESED